MSRPFVIAIASEKGGVGKTTIATNLAVYLKALNEDLPVTITSFDNHFSVDQMFALGPHPEASIADALDGCPVGDLAVMGQYGVQYIASSRRLQPPPHAPAWLHQRFLSTDLSGILILDTRPILDWFTEAALLAADLVLVPIKDRAALVNAGSIRKILKDAGRLNRLWLVPSLVDTRARLNAEVRVHEFLTYAARERDYQVLDLFISKSPKVESLASGFSSRIRPVLTHARNTAVHSQLKSLAEFVLERFKMSVSGRHDCVAGLSNGENEEIPDMPRRRIVDECPFCLQHSRHGVGYLFFDLSSRRRGLIHRECFESFIADQGLNVSEQDDFVALTIDGPGLVGPECCLTMHLFDNNGQLSASESISLDKKKVLASFLQAMLGRSLEESYREFILINRDAFPSDEQLVGDRYKTFSKNRRLIARELRQAGLF